MRSGLILALLLTASAAVAADDKPARRYDVEADLKTFPQSSPKEAFASVVKAIEMKRIDYLLAQLTDPAWVDGRVERSGDNFKQLLDEATAKLDDAAVKKLRRFLEEGDVETGETSAQIVLKDVKDWAVQLRKIGPRWYFVNSFKPQ
jgi:hypothetical protein